MAAALRPLREAVAAPHPAKGRRYPVERGEDDFCRLVELVKLMQKLIDAGHFIPNDGSHFCPGCGFQNTCREWHLNPNASPQLATAG
jgi:hypothetical protein